MNLSNFLAQLNRNDNRFYIEYGNRPERIHLHNFNSNYVSVPSKANPRENNLCQVVFAHIYRTVENLYWLDRANHSGTIIGHQCIPNIFEMLTSNEIEVTNEKGFNTPAKVITQSKFTAIILPALNAINMASISLSDVNYNPIAAL